MDDSAFQSGVGPSGAKGVTKLISINPETGRKVAETKASEPFTPAPHVPSKNTVTDVADTDTPKAAPTIKVVVPGEQTTPPVTNVAPEETKVTEEKPADVITAEDEKSKFSQQFLKVSRMEKKNLETKKTLDAREQSLAEREKGIENVIKARAKFQENPEENAIIALELLGTSYDAITKALLKLDANKDPVAQLKEKVDTLETNMTEAQKQEEQRALDGFLRSAEVTANKMISADNEDRWELVRMNGKEAIDIVRETVLNYFEETKGEVAPMDLVLDQVENHYIDRHSKYSASKKLSKHNGATDTAPTTEAPTNSTQPSNGTQQQASGSKTLENNDSTTGPQGQARRLTREEKLQNAAKLLRWT